MNLDQSQTRSTKSLPSRIISFCASLINKPKQFNITFDKKYIDIDLKRNNLNKNSKKQNLFNNFTKKSNGPIKRNNNFDDDFFYFDPKRNISNRNVREKSIFSYEQPIKQGIKNNNNYNNQIDFSHHFHAQSTNASIGKLKSTNFYFIPPA